MTTEEECMIEGFGGEIKLDTRYINNSAIGQNNTLLPADNSAHTGATSVDKNWVHDSEILKNQWTDILNPVAREGMATYQEYAKVICKKVATLLTRNELTIYYKEAKPVNKNKRREHKPAMLFWQKYDMQSILRKAIEKVREQGFIVYTHNPRYKQSPMNEMYARIFTMRQISIIQDAKPGVAGVVQGNEVRYNSSISFTLQPSEYLFYDPHNTDNGLGLSELAAVWNKLLSLECIGSSLEIFVERLGNGFLHADLPGGAPPEVKTYIKNAIKNVRSEMGILTESDGENKVSLEMISPQSNAIFDQLLSNIKQDIAVGSELPMNIFLADQVDMTILLPILQSFANIYEIMVRKILKFERVIDSLADVEIDFNIGKPTLDIEVNQAEIAANSVIAGKTWLSINEKRFLDHELPPIPGGEGLMYVLPGSQFSQELPQERIGTSNNSGFKSFSNNLNDKEGETKPDQFERKQELKDRTVIPVEHTEATDKDQFKHKQSQDETEINAGRKKEDSISVLVPLLKNLTPKEIEDNLHVSKGTAQKIHDWANTKEKDYSVKLDSYSYNGQRVKFSNAVMLAPSGDLDHGDHIERITPQEISKWFNDKNVTKELNLGIEYYPNHNGGQAEIKRAESIGTIKAMSEDPEGRVYADGEIDIVKIDQMLGDDNWVKPLVEKGEPLNLSAGMFVKEKWVTDVMLERQNLDIRSVMLVKEGRNSGTKITKG